MVVITFAGVAAAGLVLSLAVERLLRGHLKRVLVDLCETEARTGFWVAVTGLSIVLTGVLAATATFGYSDEAASGYQLFLGAMTQTRTLLIGLLGIVLVLAVFLLRAIQRYEARNRLQPTPQRRADPTTGSAAGGGPVMPPPYDVPQ